MPLSLNGAYSDGGSQVLWEEGERVFRRGWGLDDNGKPHAVLIVLPAADHPSRSTVDHFSHEYELKDELDGAWAVRPLDLVRDAGQIMLVLEDAGGEPLDRLLGAPMEVGRFLRLAIRIVVALGKLHHRGLVHKDIKPANIVVSDATGEVRLTGFGIASRFERERQSPHPPETIAGTLAYMAPEQTGRMNRSIDSRSDLYAVGITFYQMLTGGLPFNAADPMEWVHCHIARQPSFPAVSGVPLTVSALVMKLLAKAAEDRYQTAAGLEQDLRHCLSDWETLQRVDPFPLGERDIPSRLLIPEKLYGRERDIDTLLAAFDSVLANGAPELVLVSGYSGIGKSAVVNELHKVLVLPRGLFASGKFDQYKRDIPYATLAQAFQNLTRHLLSQSEAELAKWRDNFNEALGPNGLLIVDLVPELKLIIGEQPSVPELPLQEAKGRFQLVFRRFISVFARAEHPLALFLDDLQWLDVATLELLEHLLTQPDVRHLLLIGAYRDNEVSAAHPLMRKLEAIHLGGANIRQITLAPLDTGDLAQLTADSLHCDSEQAAPLAQLILQKTAGNPFFAIQFISTLVDEGLLTFDHANARWRWDLNRIEAQGYTDNVVDLVVGKLSRLPAPTQDALKQLACLGNVAEITKLGMIHGGSEAALDKALWEAVRAGIVFRQEGTYTFLHDRVHEAAYALIPAGEQAAAHVSIGRLLASRMPPEEIEENVFEIVNQLNRGIALVASVEERKRVAELNLLAGKRAKGSTAYSSALSYLAAGRALLPEDCWERCPTLSFALEFHRAECEFLTGELAAAEERLSMLSSRAELLNDFAAITCLRQSLYTTLDRSDLAVEACFEYLRHVGIELSMQPTKEEVHEEYDRMWQQIGNRPIEELLQLPSMADPDSRATLDVFAGVAPATLFTDENLLCLIVGRMANLSLEHGNSDGSCFAYVWLGAILGSHFGDYRNGFRFGKLGVDLVERRGLDRFRARACLAFANIVSPWSLPVRTGLQWVRRAFDAAQEIGDLTFAAYARNTMITFLLIAGDPLEDVQAEAESALEFVQKARFGLVADIVAGPVRLVRALRGLTQDLASFNDAEFDEARFEQPLETDPRLAAAACRYLVRKLQARFLAGDYLTASAAAARVEQVLWTSRSFFEAAEFYFYGALTRAALCDSASVAERAGHLKALLAHHRQLQHWAENCPETFQNRAALVGAEAARLERRELDAERLYETAIKSARENEFVHNEALANELAARFYSARGFETIANAYLREARSCYMRWGAEGKVRQLETRHPHLREFDTVAVASTITARIDHLDFATVVKISQALSGEMVQERLIGTLLRTALEQAGAERGLLILWRAGEPRIAAEARTNEGTVIVHLRDAAVVEELMPASVFHYVRRTHESVIIDDAATQATFAADPYIRRCHARSILCLPLLNQAKLIGVLLLENHLAPGVFAPAQITVLKLASSLAAIALENSRLYSDLQEREAKIRRLVDANIIGIFLFDLEGRIIDANDAFLRMVGYERTDLVSDRMRWTDLTPPNWRRRDAERVEEVKMTGTAQVREKEYFRKDGSRVPVLVGAATFEETGDQGVAFVLDLTESKRAEAALREAQAELAHMNRVTTMGQLTAMIAHEVSQPISAAITNAQAALRWLRGKSPDLEEVRAALDRIVEAGNRAGDVVSRIRASIKKAPGPREPMDINATISEVSALIRSEMASDGIVLQTQLGINLPSLRGDRVQLAQVVLNLLLNALEAMRGVEGARELWVETSCDRSGGVLVSVRDSGPGLPPEIRNRLFEPFTTTKPGGMGMGLSICRSIIEAHGGRLWASSNVPRGASFQFTVPAFQEDQTESVPMA